MGDDAAGLIGLRRGVQPLPDGAYRVRLGRQERELLGMLAAELEELVVSEHEAVGRLFPAAYRDDPAAQEEFERMTRGALSSGRRQAARLLRETAEKERLSQEEADAWCGALNDLRLVLGERLAITEDLYETGIEEHDPRAPELAVYGWLTWLQASVVDALAFRL